MKLYLDDKRDAPEGFRLVRDNQSALSLLRLGNVDELSVDHDLATTTKGYNLLLWLEDKIANDKTYVPPRVLVHSQNYKARERLLKSADRINSARAKRVK